MSKYLKIYEALCPDDPISDDDPRLPGILAEMRDIHCAPTEEDAIKVIEWWQAWPNSWHLIPEEFVRDARAMMRGEMPIRSAKQRQYGEKYVATGPQQQE